MTVPAPSSVFSGTTTWGGAHSPHRAITKEHQVEEDVRHFGSRGIRCLAVARGERKQRLCAGDGNDDDEDGDDDATDIEWSIVGLLTFLDPPREDTKDTLLRARQLGLGLKMVTGDHLLIAREMARQLSIGADILPAARLPRLDPITHSKPANLKEKFGNLIVGADGFAQVFPEHKYLIVECLRELGYKVGMTGDGVNDAPALKAADVGIAVSGATDAANAAADIVLTRAGLSTIVEGIVLARMIFARLRNFVVYRVAATTQLLFFFFIAVFAFRPVDYNEDWPVFFALPVLLLMLITLLNDSTMVAIAYDNVMPSQTPCVWNLRVLFTVGGVLAAVACLSSLLLLWALLTSNEPGSFFQVVGLGGLNYGQITASIYLKVSVSDFLTLFSARTGEHWFWESMPHRIVAIAAGVALTTSTIIACLWPMSYPDGVETEGLLYESPRSLFVWIWIYCIVWWFVQDAAKVGTFHVLQKYNVFDINDTGVVVYQQSTLDFMSESDAAKASLLSNQERSV